MTQHLAHDPAPGADSGAAAIPPLGRRIVVGVDGSPGSDRALRWAITQAQLTDASVEAVASWQDPVASGAYSFGFAPVLAEDEDWVTLTEKYLQESVARAVDELHSRVRIVTRVVQGHPAQALLNAATGAELLVVGSRGHGKLAGMLLGSVSQHCVQHAPCPVVVVPTDDQEANPS
jgi:nucleotide-binding universal stress UspA family protein